MVTTSNKNYIVNGPNTLVWLESSEWSETFEIKTFYQNWIDIVRTNLRAETSLQKKNRRSSMNWRNLFYFIFA